MSYFEVRICLESNVHVSHVLPCHIASEKSPMWGFMLTNK